MWGSKKAWRLLLLAAAGESTIAGSVERVNEKEDSIPLDKKPSVGLSASTSYLTVCYTIAC